MQSVIHLQIYSEKLCMPDSFFDWVSGPWATHTKSFLRATNAVFADVVILISIARTLCTVIFQSLLLLYYLFQLKEIIWAFLCIHEWFVQLSYLSFSVKTQQYYIFVHVTWS